VKSHSWFQRVLRFFVAACLVGAAAGISAAQAPSSRNLAPPLAERAAAFWEELARHYPFTALTVTASRTVQVEPTLAVVNAAVDAIAERAAEAESQVRQRIEALSALLEERGAALTVGHFTIYPRWEYRGERAVQSGFEARRQIAVSLEEVDRVGEIVQLLLDAGVNEIHGISYGLKDESEARRAAIEQALSDAREQAEAAAAAVGKRVGSIQSIALEHQVNAYYGGPLTWDGSGSMAPSPATVQANVVVEYLLVPGGGE